MSMGTWCSSRTVGATQSTVLIILSGGTNCIPLFRLDEPSACMMLVLPNQINCAGPLDWCVDSRWTPQMLYSAEKNGRGKWGRLLSSGFYQASFFWSGRRKFRWARIDIHLTYVGRCLEWFRNQCQSPRGSWHFSAACTNGVRVQMGSAKTPCVWVGVPCACTWYGRCPAK